MDVWVLVTDGGEPVAVYKTEEGAKQGLLEMLDEFAECSHYDEEEYAEALKELEEEGNQISWIGAFYQIPYFED